MASPQLAWIPSPDYFFIRRILSRLGTIRRPEEENSGPFQYHTTVFDNHKSVIVPLEKSIRATDSLILTGPRHPNNLLAGGELAP
jgi:hypothetical protein